MVGEWLVFRVFVGATVYFLAISETSGPGESYMSSVIGYSRSIRNVRTGSSMNKKVIGYVNSVHLM